MDKLYKSKSKKFFANNHETWGHKWGYKDSRFILNDDRTVRMLGNRYELCGIDMPDFIPYVEEMLDVKIDPEDMLQQNKDMPINPPNINDNFVEKIKKTFPNDRYTFADDDRLIHSHGQTTSDEVYKILYSSIDTNVDMVFYLESE